MRAAGGGAERQPRRLRYVCTVGACVGVCGLVALFNSPKLNLDRGGRGAWDPSQSKESLEESRLSARKGLVPYGGKGPRPPADERERRWAEIPIYEPEKDVLFYSHIHKTSGTSLSVMLGDMFPRSSVLPTSHPYRGLQLSELTGHDEDWWEDYQVMFSHNRPNITDDIGFPATKRPRLLLAVRNPLLHKASIYFESVCRFGLHIKNGTIDQEEATRARLEGKSSNRHIFSFCRDPALWVESDQFGTVYRNFQANWLSYGAAGGHPCISPNPELNQWRKGGEAAQKAGCGALSAAGEEEEIWEEYFERTADAAIKRLESALWVGVTERTREAVCLLFFTLGKQEANIGRYRLKEPRPITVWGEEAVTRAAEHDKADWRVFDAANDILDLRLWTARERLKSAGNAERERLGTCFEVLTTGRDSRPEIEESSDGSA